MQNLFGTKIDHELNINTHSDEICENAGEN